MILTFSIKYLFEIYFYFAVTCLFWNDPLRFPFSGVTTAKGNVLEVFEHFKSLLMNMFTKSTGKSLP